MKNEIEEIKEIQAAAQQQGVYAVRSLHESVSLFSNGLETVRHYFPEQGDRVDATQQAFAQARSLLAEILNDMILNPRYPIPDQY